jgi:hypothetical protein
MPTANRCAAAAAAAAGAEEAVAATVANENVAAATPGPISPRRALCLTFAAPQIVTLLYGFAVGLRFYFRPAFRAAGVVLTLPGFQRCEQLGAGELGRLTEACAAAGHYDGLLLRRAVRLSWFCRCSYLVHIAHGRNGHKRRIGAATPRACHASCACGPQAVLMCVGLRPACTHRCGGMHGTLPGRVQMQHGPPPPSPGCA